MMVAGTAAAVGVALTNGRRLTPVFVEASPAPRPALATLATGAATLALPDPRTFFARRFALAVALAAGGILAVAAIAAIGTIIVQQAGAAPPASPAVFGPSAQLRAASQAGAGLEHAYSSALPGADAVGGTLLAAAEERHAWEVLRAMKVLDEQRRSEAAARQAAIASPGTPRSLNGSSGYAVGTVLRARITIYGCVGAGGGFCNNMSTGIKVFEGAAACSGDLPFGTRVRIHGDPTGRVYECLDRGALAATWVDVFFYDTAAGIAWQSLLGGTVADVEIVN
jgi:hypothetical protein